MTFDHFLTLEDELLRDLNLSSDARMLILRLIKTRKQAIEEIRNGKRRIPRGTLTGIPQRMQREITTNFNSPVGVPPMSTAKIAGLATVIADVSILFTTRDWGVAGTMSTIAGGLVFAAE
jgi:hypothetical protein